MMLDKAMLPRKPVFRVAERILLLISEETEEASFPCLESKMAIISKSNFKLPFLKQISKTK